LTLSWKTVPSGSGLLRVSIPGSLFAAPKKTFGAFYGATCHGPMLLPILFVCNLHLPRGLGLLNQCWRGAPPSGTQTEDNPALHSATELS